MTYSYDSCAFGLGHLCARNDESGNTVYDYDAFGNKSSKIFTEIEGTDYTTSYLYDDGDRLKQMTLPSNRVIDYTRDGVRRLSAINTTVNGNAQTVISNILYRGDNQMLSCDLGNGLNDTRTYDLQGRLRSQQLTNQLNTPIDQRTYSYDINSNINTITTNLENNAYGYDKRDRLTSDTINTDDPNIFGYDLNDNRQSKSRQDLSLENLLYYQPASNRISSVETFQTGNTPIPNTANRELVYNDVGRLFQLIEDDNLKAEYIYNDLGQRTRKTTYQSDGLTIDKITIYHYDQMGYLITETTETGQLIKDYIWQEGMNLAAQIDNTTGTEQMLYLYSDHLMTSRLATDQSQNIVWRWEGEAFGETATLELAGFSVNVRFPGQYYDSETGLHYNYQRYYDPFTGRYITSDPIGLAGGLNTYAYVNGNPVNFIDPDGQFAINIAGGVFGIISGSVGGYISSGGDFNAALLGGLAGGVVGVINPLGGLAGVFIGNTSASAVGQVVGNITACNEPLDIDLSVAVASGIGGTVGAGVGHYLSIPTRSASAFVISRGLGPSRPYVREFFKSIVEGSVGGVTEFIPGPTSNVNNGCECR